MRGAQPKNSSDSLVTCLCSRDEGKLPGTSFGRGVFQLSFTAEHLTLQASKQWQTQDPMVIIILYHVEGAG